MKILKRASIIAAAYYLIVVFAGCYGKCEKQRYKSYGCEGLQLGITEYVFESDSAYTPHIFMEDTLPYLSYGISLNFSISKFAGRQSSGNVSLINTAQAWKCNEPSIYPKDTIASIQVQTLRDFDTDHPEGADVSDYFVALRTEYSPKRIERHSLDYLAHKPDYIHERMIGYNIPIYLNATPTSARYVQFEVTVQFTNGKTLSAVSDEVFLK